MFGETSGCYFTRVGGRQGRPVWYGGLKAPRETKVGFRDLSPHTWAEVLASKGMGKGRVEGGIWS